MIIISPMSRSIIINFVSRHVICSSEFRSLVSNAQRGWSAWNCTIDRILVCCGEVWKVVRRVLCFDSPEGFELEDDDDNDVSVGTKDTLSFSWRALKESRLVSKGYTNIAIEMFNSN